MNHTIPDILSLVRSILRISCFVLISSIVLSVLNANLDLTTPQETRRKQQAKASNIPLGLQPIIGAIESSQPIAIPDSKSGNQEPTLIDHQYPKHIMSSIIRHGVSQKPLIDSKFDHVETESGYASASSHSDDSNEVSKSQSPILSLTKTHIHHLNRQLEPMHPMDILRWCRIMFPQLYQSTAFGLTGLATLDMLSKIQVENPESNPIHLIFLDTLYHFQETYDLIDRVQQRYPNVPLHIFKPDACETAEQMEESYGRLYETSSEMYDWIVKVEPLQRAYEQLHVAAVLNGRRRSQGAARGSIPIIELDEERGIIKINPLAAWNFTQVQQYIKENNVPYNALLDQGYKSVGDWHSTSPVKDGEDERAGRWKGQSKTECGIHNKRSRYGQLLEDMSRKQEHS